MLVLGFTSDFLFYDDDVTPVHICYTCILTLLSSLLDIIVMYTFVLTLARHLAFASHSPGEFHLTPLDPHVQVLELGACEFSPLLIGVAQR